MAVAARGHDRQGRNLWDNDEFVMLILFLVSSLIFFSSTAGIYTSNAGSHYALVRALVENRSFAINSFAYYTGLIDYAEYKGNAYSDRAPGTAFAAAPFYAAGKFASNVIPVAAYYSGYDAGNPAAFATVLMPVFMGGLCAAMVYLICRSLGGGVYSSAIASLSFSLGTIIWKYSSVLFSHSLSAFLMLYSIYAAITLKDFARQRLQSCALFFCLGYLPVVEYANAPLSVIVLAYLVFTKKLTVTQILSFKGEYITPFACLAAAALILLAYNYYNFGNPLSTAYDFAPQHPWGGSLSEAFTTPILEGVTGLMFANRNIESGLLFVSPFILLSLWGYYYLYRSRRNEALLLAALFIAHLIVYGRHKTWFGGAVADTRYLLTVTAVISLPIFMWIEGFLQKRKTQFEMALWEGVMWALITVSVLNVAYDVATFENHGVREFAFPMLTPAEVGRDVSGAFPSLGMLPAYVGAVAVAYSILSLALRRAPGLDAFIQDRAKYNATVAGIGVIGAVILVLSASPPKAGLSLSYFEVSADGIQWAKGEVPFSLDQPRMFVRGVVDVKGPGTKVALNVAAEDCLREIYINDRHVGSAYNCTPCMHCQGVQADLTRFMQTGPNKIAFEVEGLGNTTKFMIQKSG